MQNIEEIGQIARQTRKTNWDSLIIIAIFHVLAVVALFYFSWTNLIVMLILNWVAESLGVGVGFHRLLTHRSFKAPKWLEYVLTVFGTLAVQSGSVKWVATHRLHHQHTETEHDPHSPREEGAFWAHIGWILQGKSQEHDSATFKKVVPDLLKDRFHVFVSNYYYMTSVILGIILFAFGGFGLVLWGVFFRTVFGWHSTWLVNSATHMWGTRRFETRDDSTNNALIAVFSFGEGWHNNHHAHPTSARHGLKWYEFDMNWMAIKTFEKFGWAKQIKVYDLEQSAIKTTHKA